MKKFIPFFLVFTAFFSSCRKDKSSWDTNVLIPVAHASLSIDNLVADSLTSTAWDGSVKLVYSTTFPGLSTDSLLQIPDTTLINEYNIPFGYVNFNPGDFITPNTPGQTAFGITSASLVFAILDEGMLKLHLQNDITKRVVLQYSIPSATKNNIPFDTSFTLDAAQDSLHGYFRDVTIDLSGYSVDFTGTNHDRVNTVSTLFTAQIDPAETGQAHVTYVDTVACFTTFTGIKPFYMRGYFGNQATQIGPEEQNLSFFNRIMSGSLGLDSLTMNFHLNNYVGMDARVTINGIWTKNTRTGQQVNLTNSVIGTPINVTRSLNATGWPAPVPSSYNFTFDNSNSNAKNLVENLPDRLGYDFTVVTNPLGNVSGNNDFLFRNWGIDAGLDIEMPLHFYANQLVVQDTASVSIGSGINTANIISGKLTLYAQNSFPFSAGVQVYMLNDAGQITDSLVALPNTIASGSQVSSGPYIISAGFVSSTLTLPMNETQTQNFLGSKKLLIKATFDTNSAPAYVKIYSSNRLDLQLSANFDYRAGF